MWGYKIDHMDCRVLLQFEFVGLLFTFKKPCTTKHLIGQLLYSSVGLFGLSCIGGLHQIIYFISELVVHVNEYWSNIERDWCLLVLN